MSILIDTTLLIDVLRGRPVALDHVERAIRAGEELTTSAANVAELYAGMRPGEKVKTAALLMQLRCVPVTFPIAKLAGEFEKPLGQHWRHHSPRGRHRGCHCDRRRLDAVDR